MKRSVLFILAASVALLSPSAALRADDIRFTSQPAAGGAATSESAMFDVGGQQRPVSLCGYGNCDCCSMPRFGISAALLYLKPTSGSLEYGTLVSPLPPASPHWENQAINPRYSPAFNIGVQYFVPDTANDMGLSWTHLDASAGDSFIGRPDQFAGPPYLIGPGANNYNVGYGNVRFNYNAANFEAGHWFRTSGPFQVRTFGGVQYGSIIQNLSGTFRDYGDTIEQTNTTFSSFSGAGPRFGLNSRFNWSNFQVIGDMAAVALIGSQHLRQEFVTNSAGFPNNAQSFNSPNNTQIVPGFDARLGGAYVMPLRNSIFKIEGGYQAIVYLNAINGYSFGQVATPPVVGGVGVFMATAQHTQSNFTAQGPYVSASWVF